MDKEVNRSFPHASETFKRLNPHLFGGIRSSVSKPDSGRLPKVSCGEEEGKASVAKRCAELKSRAPLARISLVSLRHRELDSGNIEASFKFIQDCVADELLPGLPPGRADEFFRWEYGQCLTRGTERTVVVIEPL